MYARVIWSICIFFSHSSLAYNAQRNEISEVGFGLFHLLLFIPSPVSEAVVKKVRICPFTATNGDQLPGVERTKPRLVLVQLMLPLLCSLPMGSALEDWAQHRFHKNLSDLHCGFIHMLSDPSEPLFEAYRVLLTTCSCSWNKLQMQSSVWDQPPETTRCMYLVLLRKVSGAIGSQGSG